MMRLRIGFLGGLLVVVSLGIAFPKVANGACQASTAKTWRRWQGELITDRGYSNPYRDVTLRVTFSQGNTTFSVYGFWDGGEAPLPQTFRFRTAFPTTGTWNWTTSCTGDNCNLDADLHGQCGSVNVTRFQGANELYRRGFLSIVSLAERVCNPTCQWVIRGSHFVFRDGTPFLWLGDTAWAGPLRATYNTSDPTDWVEYILNRKTRGFTVVQVGGAASWMKQPNLVDANGNAPFVVSGSPPEISSWNPPFWQGFDTKIQYANEQGLAVVVVGLME